MARILEAACDLFYREGLSGAGVDAVAMTAGMIKRTLYYHYSSKDALIATMVDRQHDLTLEHIEKWARADAQTAGEAIEALFRNIRTWASSPGW